MSFQIEFFQILNGTYIFATAGTVYTCCTGSALRPVAMPFAVT